MKRLWKPFAVLTALLLVFSLGSPSPSQGYSLIEHVWTDRTLSFCFTNGGFGMLSSTQQTVIAAGITTKWNGVANVYVHEDCGVFGNFYDVAIYKAPIDANAAASCINWYENGAYDYSGRLKNRCTKAVIIFNSNSIDAVGQWNWGNSYASVDGCYMLPMSDPEHCKVDGKTVAGHEFGHVLGIGHAALDSDDCKQGRMISGNIWWPYRGSEILAACNDRGEKLMAEFAGNYGWYWGRQQGFRVFDLHQDDINAVVSLYGPY